MLRAVCIILLLSSVTTGKKKECKPDLQNHEARLKQDLFGKEDHETSASPVNNYKQRINVSIHLEAARIRYNPVDAGSGNVDYIVMDMQYVMTWNVPCLKWDPMKYGNVTKLNKVEYKIWKPVFVLEEKYSDMYNFHYLLGNRCSVKADGSVGCSRWHYYMLPCPQSRYALWPYDSNTCVLNMVSDPATEQAFNLDITTDDTFKKAFCNGDWTVKSIKTAMYNPAPDDLTISKPKSNNTGYKIEIALRRDSGTIAACIVCPILVMSTLTLTALCLHIYNFNKVYMAMVSLGLHIVVNIIITEELPGNFSEPPLLVAFVRDSLAFTSLVLLSALLTHYLFHRLDTPPGFAVAITNLCFYTSASVLIFYNAPTLNKGPKPENKGESSDDKIVAEIDNNTIWVRLACIINSVVIIVIGFSYLVYMCMLLQIPIEISK